MIKTVILAIRRTLQNKATVKTKPSKWALLVQEIESTPELQLGDYAVRLKGDMGELKEHFEFPSDV
jgi:hypothetical protein